MVLATGDGKTTEQGSSFTQQVRRAAKRGWQVEIWSWADSLSPLLRITRAEFPNNVKVFKLDEWYRSIVFLKGGPCILNNETIDVTARRCSPPSLTESSFLGAETSGAA
jgi:hypothetical protein